MTFIYLMFSDNRTSLCSGDNNFSSVREWRNIYLPGEWYYSWW